VLPAPLNTVSVNGITLSSQQNGATYQWIDCATNLPVPGAINQSFTTSEPTGNFAVIVTLEGCQDTSDCFFVDQSGLDEATLDFSVQPNPSTQDFQVTWTGQVLTLKLFDAAGKTVWEQGAEGLFQATIPAAAMASGVYYLRFGHPTGQQTTKILKY
jgi:hypothetical protein